jgi:hypothetical protein
MSFIHVTALASFTALTGKHDKISHSVAPTVSIGLTVCIPVSPDSSMYATNVTVMTKKSQVQKFREAAGEVECDKSEERFDAH